MVFLYGNGLPYRYNIASKGVRQWIFLQRNAAILPFYGFVRQLGLIFADILV